MKSDKLKRNQTKVCKYIFFSFNSFFLMKGSSQTSKKSLKKTGFSKIEILLNACASARERLGS